MPVGKRVRVVIRIPAEYKELIERAASADRRSANFWIGEAIRARLLNDRWLKKTEPEK